MRKQMFAAAALVLLTLTGCGAYKTSQGRCVFVTWDEGQGRVEHPLEGADPRSFQVVVRNEFARDATHVYHHNLWMKEADARTFTVLRGSLLETAHGALWAKDARHVWIGDGLLRGADPATFRPLKFPYSRDAARVFCGTEPMSADPATFTADGIIGKDKAHRYIADRIQP